MPVDAFAVAALAAELSGAIAGGRIDKIHMPSKFEVHLIGRGAHGAFRLLLSAHPQHPRAHLTQIARENPQSPPMFCMLLRKHLTGGRFAGVRQPYLERVLHFDWDATDEMGAVSKKTLTIEMIGKHSNIILVDSEGRIVDCMRRVDPDMSPQRPVLPGLFYRDPPSQGKTDPLTVSEADFTALLSVKVADMPLNVWIGNTFTAIPPLLSSDIADAINSDRTPFSRFIGAMSYVKQNDYTPYKIKNGTDFFSLPLTSIPQERFDGTFSELLDEIYTRRDQSEQISARASALLRSAKNARDKLIKKQGYLRQEHLDAQNREHLREQADLLMANLHRAVRGDESIIVEDFYHDNTPLTIRLDPAKSPQQNAAAFYKAYAKAKNAETALEAQIKLAEQDLVYWESVIEQLSRVASITELNEIQEELKPGRQTKGKTPKVSQPLRFRSSEGILFRAGRNNRQNDLLTMKLAGRGDIWLHTQKIPGCHVVIDTAGGQPGEQTLYEAAVIAAWFSQAKTSPKVPVDYTQVKYVKKPPSARPGMVIYDRFQTILAQPDGELAERLRIE